MPRDSLTKRFKKLKIKHYANIKKSVRVNYQLPVSQTGALRIAHAIKTSNSRPHANMLFVSLPFTACGKLSGRNNIHVASIGAVFLDCI